MLAKNLSLVNALWKIPVRLMLDALAAWKELLTGDSGYYIAVLKAHVHFFRWMLFEKKQSIFPVKKAGKPNGWYNRSIVWQYFIKNKKTFLEIVDNK
jgi:hypothetical protein